MTIQIRERREFLPVGNAEAEVDVENTRRFHSPHTVGDVRARRCLHPYES